MIITYDHTHWKTRDPVRTLIDKPMRARLVVGSMTTSESLVLYVFFSCFFPISFIKHTCWFLSFCVRIGFPKLTIRSLKWSYIVVIAVERHNCKAAITRPGNSALVLRVERINKAFETKVNYQLN